ncbi:MAG: hypothetical protein QM704_21910 [Anaeromyxobacteraceae bacterium]
MTPAEHAAFTGAVEARLAADPDVLGLVGLGSTSGEPPLPDEVSDHDLWLVTRPGTQERFRTDLGWLPDAGAIALRYRETAHGVKALYASGHLVELAVFDPDELGVARVNRHRVLLDRCGLVERLARLRAATLAAAPPPPDERWEAGQLLTKLVVGAGRAARGEVLSGHALVRSGAVGHLVTLARARLAPERRALLDDLDPARRLERALPELAAEVERAVRLPVLDAARALLAIVARERPDLVSAPARAAVEAALGQARGLRRG